MTRSTLRERDDAYAEATEERVAATAEIFHGDAAVAECVMGVSRAALVLTHGRRDDLLYGTLFPAPPSTLVEGIATPEEGRFVRGLVGRIREDERYVLLRPAADELAAAEANLEAALAVRAGLYDVEARAGADRQCALDEAKRVYNLAYPELQLLYPTARALVESFFRGLSRRRPSEESPDEPTADPNGESEPR